MDYNILEINNFLNLDDIDDVLIKIDNILKTELNYNAIVLQFKLFCIKNYYDKIKNTLNKNKIKKQDIINVIIRLCYYNNYDCIKFLVETTNILNSEDFNTIIINTCYLYNNKCIEYIYEKIDINTIKKNILYENLCSGGNYNILFKLINKNKAEFENYKDNLLLCSVKSNNIDLVNLFLNNYSFDSLHYAFYESYYLGNLDIIKSLHNKNININVDNNIIDKLNNDWYDDRHNINYGVIEYLNTSVIK